MPSSAIRHVEVDHVVPLDQLPRLLVDLTAQAPSPEPPVSDDLRMEALIAAQEIRGMEHWSRAGAISPLTCPDCHGALREIQDGNLVRYRCHTGHAFTLEALGAVQEQAWERALNGAYRAQQERALLLRRMAASRRQSSRINGHLEERARGYEEGAELLRRLIAHGNGMNEPEESSQT